MSHSNLVNSPGLKYLNTDSVNEGIFIETGQIWAKTITSLRAVGIIVYRSHDDQLIELVLVDSVSNMPLSKIQFPLLSSLLPETQGMN